MSYFRSMEEIHSHIKHLLHCIMLEEQEETFRYRLDKEHSLVQLKKEGVALHPIKVTRKYFGYADYPEISFHIAFPPAQHLFRDGVSIEIFLLGEESIKGVLLGLSGKSGEFRLLAPDFPDWIEEHGVGIKLSPNQRTTSLMKQNLKDLVNHAGTYDLFQKFQDRQPKQTTSAISKESTDTISFRNTQLNLSQQQAVLAICNNPQLIVLHGPPGTGKTTTIIEGIEQLVAKGERVLISAPSNTAVDYLALSLIQKGVKILRVGNSTKIAEAILPFTPEGHLAEGKQKKELKELKIRAEEFRKMALKYKRSFGKSEREQRNLLFAEVKKIRTEIKKLMAYHEEKLYEQAKAVLGTPIGLLDAKLNHLQFETLVIDEAGQCLEPLAWSIFPLAKNIVLAGDHFQLPPTILSEKAKKLGFDTSILEQAFNASFPQFLLNVQYRMREMIVGFSSAYFYENQLQTPDFLKNEGPHLTFVDMAGSGFMEERGSEGSSLINAGEIEISQKIIASEYLEVSNTAFISPYSAQVLEAKEHLPKGLRCSTIDSFQGQESDCILLSLVRSNDDSQIGFLADYRRMNVALTRAKNTLFVIGDSATIGSNPFYKSFLEYVEKKGSYRSCYEWMG